MESEEILGMITRALDSAIADYNLEAQRSFLGLPEERDNIRQGLVNARAALTGVVHVGNLQRTLEAHKWIFYTRGFRKKLSKI